VKLLLPLATLVVLGATSAGAQAAPCCGITTIDPSTGIVTAKVNATGNTFQFKVTDPRTLASLKVGQGVYANFAGKQASLDGRSACCTITSGPTPPARNAPPARTAPTAPAAQPLTAAAVSPAVLSSIPSVRHLAGALPARAPGRGAGARASRRREARARDAGATDTPHPVRSLHRRHRDGT
jgi:hypothetical protein